MFTRNLRRIVSLHRNLPEAWVFRQKVVRIEPLAGVLKFHTSLGNPGKIFPERENDYAHGILKRVGKYHLMQDEVKSIGELLTDDEFSKISTRKDWMEASMQELVQTFERLAVYCGKNDVKIADERLDALVDAIVKQCFNFTDEEILKALQMLTHFPPSESLNTRNFVELWSALDDACVDRIARWQTEELLLVCDHWYALNLAKVSKCTFQCTKKLGKKLKSLSPTDLVQTMFYVNMCRKPMVDMFNFEVNLFESIDQLSVDEIAVMSMGFFKTETRIRNPELIEKIFERVIADIKTLQDISLVNIMKILRYSAKLQHISSLENFFKAVTPEIHRLSLLSCLHVALFGTDMQYYNQDCLENIIQKFSGDIKTCRLKEFERLSFVMGLYCFSMKNGSHTKLCEGILADLPNRITEIMKYPRCFPACLHFLTLCGHHNAELISTVLDPKFYEMAYGKNHAASREILCLDSYARINLKDTYKGHLLPDKLRALLSKIHTNYIPAKEQRYKLSAADTILLEIKEVCDQVYGQESSQICHALSQYERPDIVMVLNKKTKEAVSLKDSLSEDYTGQILSREFLLKDRPDREDLEIFSIVVGGWNILVRNNNSLTGQLRLKLEQLRLIGLHPVMIPWYTWRKLATPDDRTVYLKSLLKSQQ
ncbi:uncharacterized protein LOC132263026 [Phlebotomus argentipes]|uniref:uncharacterized protein LOC132263026 n=1 Tax=Phlebotomus argentipes TaxID=94469 RepID=UPI002892B043|nr:uncharacterized protein LOC132263026 [Phlebotomus argentipes]